VTVRLDGFDVVVVAQVNVHSENATKVSRTPPVVGQTIDHEGGQQLHSPSLADAATRRSADSCGWTQRRSLREIGSPRDHSNV
jgi:hypothetical protein